MSAYLKRAERIIREAGARLESRKGECRDCRWRAPDWLADRCKNPAVILATQTVDQGHNRDRLVRCDAQRSKSSVWEPVVCGPDGDLFERRVGFLESIFGPRKGADHD